MQERDLLVGEPTDAGRFELRAVTPDEMHLVGKPRERGEIAQRPARHHGDMGVGQHGQSTQAGDRRPKRMGVGGNVDERGDRAVVVAGDEQHRGAPRCGQRLDEPWRPGHAGVSCRGVAVSAGGSGGAVSSPRATIHDRAHA